MKRRDFIKIAAAAPVAAAVLNPFNELKGQIPPQGRPPGGFPQRSAAPVEYQPTGSGIRVRFLGTGAAAWRGPAEDGEMRRFSSILVEGKVLFDFTAAAAEMLPDGVRPQVIFYTHSHSDHYDADAAMALGIKRVYLGETWLARAREDFRKAAEAKGVPAPEIIPLSLGQTVTQDGLAVTALLASHNSNDPNELALIYLIEKDSARLLYATDTAGITSQAVVHAGLDMFSRNRKFLTGIIMEATLGMGNDENPQMFSHSSVETVEKTVRVLSGMQKYVPVPDQKVYLTHLAKHPGGSQAELDRNLPAPLRAAYDGLEVVFP